MADNDAFTAGVEFGGLRTRQDIKLLICFLLDPDGLFIGLLRYDIG